MTGGSDRLPFNWFPLQGTNASQLSASSGGASTDRSSRLCGTDAVTTSASPAAEEVRTPCALPGVCSETEVSHEWYVSCWGHFFKTLVLLPKRTHLAWNL